MNRARTTWTPWHKVVQLRDDLKSGELSLTMFAANLYDVAIRKKSTLYGDPVEFFALTFPTFAMRELAKEVAMRLAGRSDKAVRQLALTYGGGKTHTLITLYHLFNSPKTLPDLPAVNEFVQHMGMALPQARVAVLPFDYIDPTVGMSTHGFGKAPDETRQFKYPWTILAYQLGGDEGLRILGTPDGQEREDPPFTGVLEELLALPSRQGLATLVLIDEVLMWARVKAGTSVVWLDRVRAFFQCLSEAAAHIKTCTVVASLLASDVYRNDDEGKRIASEVSAALQRVQEPSIQPVQKEDVAEVLRRRLLTPGSIRDRESFRSHVVAALKGIGDLDEQTRKDGKAAEARYLNSYPFHPDLTEIFYGKWTGLESFQRTRGVLRTYALALREAEPWDDSPLVAANVFLGKPGDSGLSEASRELANIARTENTDGTQQTWSAILEGELAKARDIQAEFTGMNHRDMEQAVFATFLHSQPMGINAKAQMRELMILVGHTRPDKINLEKGLLRWAEISWFLDEGLMSDASAPASGVTVATRVVPAAWRLGAQPNLKQMHHDACGKLAGEVIDDWLLKEIAKLKSLTAGASAAGVRVHSLPDRPGDVEDDGEFHFVVLGPKAASEAGRPSPEARRFIEEVTGPDKPRVSKNALVLVAPSSIGLDIARTRIAEYMGWEEVRGQIKELKLDTVRDGRLAVSLDTARKRIPDAIKQAYCIVITFSEKGEVQAFKIQTGDDPLFLEVKADSRVRIQDAAISADALMPGGPYDLWRPGETARRVKDLVGAFAEVARLPKMLNRRAILDTLINGCVEGAFVLRLTRPDRSIRTFWRQHPDDAALKDPSLEVVLPEAATLTELPTDALIPGALPNLWVKPEITFGQVCSYFDGETTVQVQR